MLLVNNFKSTLAFFKHAMELGTREVLAGRLTDKCPKFCGLTDRLPNRSANIFGTQNFLYPIDINA